MRARAILVASMTALVACSSPGTPGPQPSQPSRSTPPAAVSTAPTDAVTFAVVGDWGAGTAAQRAIASGICERNRSTPLRFVLTTGDNFYAPDGVATQRTYFGPEKCIIDAHLRWRAVWGNHDIVASSTATALGATNRWYSFEEGGAAFFMLDSNQPDNAAQKTWLARALAETKARVKIAVFHHPPYTMSRHDPNVAVQRAWAELFRRNNVTMVLTGHNHVYEHLVVQGVDYVVSGGGGASLYDCRRHDSTSLRCASVHHFLIVEINGARVKVTAITDQARTLDQFSIEGS